MIAEQILNGLTAGCIYALTALGYTLIFGIIQVIFFAQGELSMVSAFIAIAVSAQLARIGVGGFPLLAAVLILCLAGTASVSLIAERVALRPIREADRTKQLITSLGVSFVLQNLVFLFITSGNVPFPVLLGSDRVSFGGFSISRVQIAIIVVATLVMIALDRFLIGTRLGLAMRACAENHRLARLSGINVDKVISTTFIIGGMLAAIAGIMMGSYDSVARYDMGFTPGIKAFTAAILGGMGNPRGAMLGGILIGVIEALGAGYISVDYRDLFAFVILIAILVFKPTGILGERIAGLD